MSNFHRQWFAANDNGRLEPEIIHLIEFPELGHALIRYCYRSTDPTGKVSETEVVRVAPQASIQR